MVTVRVANSIPGTGALATIYSDDGITSIGGSTVTTDLTGTFDFYAPDGKYDLVCAVAGFTKIVAAVEITDLIEANTGDSPIVINDAIFKKTPWVDVRAFGAVGDDVTDDTAAIQAAINATPHGGTLYLPPKTFFLQGTGATTQILLIPYPMRIIGSGMGTESFGSVLRIASTVPNTVDVIRLLADANGSDGYVLQDFAIQSNTQAARSAINIDTTSFPIARLTITRVGLYGAFNSFGIRTTNPAPLTNGFFVSDIGPGNIIRNGILLQNAGDSIRIWNNDIPFGNVVTSNAGIDATYVAGAQQTTISGNNITQTKGGAIHLGSAARSTYIFDNFFEGGVSGTDLGSNGALIDLDGVTGNHILHADIHDNVIQSITTNIDNIRVNFADSTYIYGNTITRPGGTAVNVRVTANGLNTMIDWNRWEPTTDALANILADAGTGTQLRLYGAQSPNSIQSASRFSITGGTGSGPLGSLYIETSTPDIGLSNLNGAADAKRWDFSAQPTSFLFRTVNDANPVNNAAPIWTVNRSGLNPTSIINTPVVQNSFNRVAVASNFTTANNTNLQTITGLSWTLPAEARSYSFHARLTYSIATAAVAVAFGIQASSAPTNIFANGTQQITVGPPATFVCGTLATLTTTTATAIVSGTPGATGTNYIVELDGTIELPASVNTVNLMVSTAAGADAVTVLRGSYAYLY